MKEKGIRVNVYLTATENEILETTAKAAGMRKATALRQMAFLKKENYEILKEMQPVLIELAMETAKQGINLNQIAKNLNKKAKGNFLSNLLKTNGNEENEQTKKAVTMAQELHSKILEILAKVK